MSIFIPPYRGFPKWQGLDRCAPDKYSGLSEEDRKSWMKKLTVLRTVNLMCSMRGLIYGRINNMSIEVTNVKVYGFEEAVRGMRNSWDSWEDSDSDFTADVIPYAVPAIKLGEKDLTLMQRLNNAGTSHSKYRRIITVSMDINAPLLFWKQMDTYSVGVTELACSTMHTITKDKFTKEIFATDHLGKLDTTNVFGYTSSLDTEVFMDSIIEYLNSLREGYIYYKNKGEDEIAKKFWRAIIDLLPSNFMQKRTWFGNYEVLAKMYIERKGHKLDEWDKFREVIQTLPYAKELIIGG